MPRWLRTFIISASDMWSTREPWIQISPPSGFNRPRISFRIVDFPEPLAPRMIFVWPGSSEKLTSRSTTFSSNANDTFVNTTAGRSGDDMRSSTSASRMA
jgi:hypothetical protein